VCHDWGNNTIIIQGNGIVITIFVTKKLGAPTKRPKILICYDFYHDLNLGLTTKARAYKGVG
jgi:hypothetical protein